MLRMLVVLNTLILLLLPSLAVVHAETEKLTFRSPHKGAITNYVVELIETAYTNLGIELEYVEMPRHRSLIEANAGRLAGELGRIPELAGEYPNLVRVDFPILSFEIVLIADRRQCGLCELEQVDNFAYIDGMRSIDALIEEHNYQGSTLRLNELEQLDRLFQTGRVQAVMLNDFEARELGYFDNRDYISTTLRASLGYHYLHESHANLVPFVEQELNKLHDNGILSSLLDKHNVKMTNVHSDEFEQEFAELRLVAGYHPGFTNRDGSGFYWRFMQHVFAPISDGVSLNTNPYQRAIAGMNEGRFDVLVGVYNGHQPANSIISATHFDYDRPLYLYANNELDLAAAKTGLLNRPVCHAEGFAFEEFLSDEVDIYQATNPYDCFTLLEMGRVAAVVSYSDEQPAATRRPKIAELLHPSLPLHVAFQDNLTGRKLRAWFDNRMRELVRSGEIVQHYNEDALERSFLGLSLPQTTAPTSP